MKIILSFCILVSVLFAGAEEAKTPPPTCAEIPVTDLEWKEKLSPQAYRILRERGTERAFSGALLAEKRKGSYHCAGCNTKLFVSDAKFESGTGWPSFFQPASAEALGKKEDNSHGMKRTEVFCATCKGHLGHVFDDGPKPSGLRYCINSVTLVFVPAE